MIASLRLAAMLSALACMVMLPAPVRAGDAGVLVLGRISADPHTHYDQLKPLLDYVVPRMADVGIREGRILMARDARQMASHLRRGQVDWLTEAAGGAALLGRQAGAESLLLAERDGAAQQRTVFFARRDSGLRSLDGMRGRSVAFQQPSSTCAYLAPAAELLRRGLNLERLMSPADSLAPDSVGYLFAGSGPNISTWVHKGLVDVGVTSNLDWDNPQRMPAALRTEFAIIGESDPYPQAVELVRRDLDPRVRTRLREVLIEAANDPDAHEAMLRFFKTTRFVPVDPASRRTLLRLGDDVARIRAELE